MIKLPIVVDSSFVQPLLLNFLRTALVAIGASLQAKGWLPADLDLSPVAQSIAGQLLIVVGLLWSAKRVVTNTAEKKTMEAALPDDIAVRKDAPSNVVLKFSPLAVLLVFAVFMLGGCASLGAVGRLGAVRTVGVNAPLVCAAQAKANEGLATPQDFALLAAFDSASAAASQQITALTKQPARVILECE